jgi:hypothetical protein
MNLLKFDVAWGLNFHSSLFFSNVFKLSSRLVEQGGRSGRFIMTNLDYNCYDLDRRLENLDFEYLH